MTEELGNLVIYDGPSLVLIFFIQDSTCHDWMLNFTTPYLRHIETIYGRRRWHIGCWRINRRYCSCWALSNLSIHHRSMCGLANTSFGTRQLTASKDFMIDGHFYEHKTIGFNETDMHFRKAYWTKALRGEYLPAVTIDNALILSYLRSLKISQKTTNVEEQWSWLSEGLAFLRRRTKGVSGPQFTWTTVMTAVLVILSKKLLGYLKNNKHLFFV